MYLLYALRQRKRRIYRFTAVLGMGFFLLGIARIWYMQQQSYTIETILKEQETGLSVETDASRGWQTESEKTILQGKIEKKERKNNQTRLYLNHVFLRIGDNTYKTNSVLVRLKQEPSDQSCRIGTTIVLEGNIRQLNRAANDGNYDEFQYYHSLNMDYHFDAERICGEYGREDVLTEKFFMIKEKLKEDYINNLSERNAGILGTMLLGDKELLEKEVSTVFQQAGASHVLVISGMHISCIGLFCYGLLRKKGNSLCACTAAVVFLLCYVKMTGMGISAIRAWIMFALLMAAKLSGRSYDSRTALSVAVLVLLWKNPYLVENAGLQFSVAAILGVVVVAKCIGQLFSGEQKQQIQKQQMQRQQTQERKTGDKAANKIREKWKRQIRQNFFVSLSVQLTTLPLVAYYYYEVPVYALFLNLLIVSLLSVVLINGIAATLLMCMEKIVVGRLFAGPVIMMLELLLDGIYAGASWCSRLPGATKIVGQWPIQRIIFYYLMLAAACLLIKNRTKKSGNRDGNRNTNILLRKFPIVLIGSVVLLLVLRPVKSNHLMAVLDVGQGDGIYVRLGEDTNLFLDGGSTDVSKVGTYRILPFLKSNGITKIDYWFISHYDEDHVNGLLEVLETEYSVKNIILPGKQPDVKNYQSICALAERRNIPILYMKEGDCIRSGEDTISCLLPDGEYQAEDENGKSMILLYQTKYISGIFTGDAGEAEENWLLEKQRLWKVDFLKVGHHGSKYSSTEKFLKALSPELALISCGENNRYGHPHQETINRLKEASAEIFDTMEGGQISLEEEKGRITIQSFR